MLTLQLKSPLATENGIKRLRGEFIKDSLGS